MIRTAQGTDNGENNRLAVLLIGGLGLRNADFRFPKRLR